jgi:hypothetical protein
LGNQAINPDNQTTILPDCQAYSNQHIGYQTAKHHSDGQLSSQAAGQQKKATMLPGNNHAARPQEAMLPDNKATTMPGNKQPG